MLKRFLLAVALLSASLLQVPAQVQAQSDTPPDDARRAERRAAAETVIRETLAVSRAMEFWQDARLALKQVYIPVFKDAIKGDIPATPAPDAKTAALMAKTLTAMDYASQAADQLDAALNDFMPDMIRDAAAILADTNTAESLDAVRSLMQQPAVRKSVDALYSMSRILTGLSVEDARVLSEFSSWARALDLDVRDAMGGAPNPKAGPNLSRRLAKAQALMNDGLRITRLDELTVEVFRFVREVYLPNAKTAEPERQEFTGQIDQMEFMYNFQKSIMLAAAPSMLAAILSDEEVAIIHTFVLSPTFARISDSFYNAAKSSLSISADELKAMTDAMADIDKRSALKAMTPAEKDALQKRWEEFGTTWEARLKSRIAPDVLSGLDASLKALQQETAN